MKNKVRNKIIAIALVATLACSSSAVGVFAATPQEDTEIGVDVVQTETEQRQTELLPAQENTEEPAQETPTGKTDVPEAENMPARAADVAIDAANFPDASFRTFVRQYDTDGNGSLSDMEIAAVTAIDCSNQGILSLQGIEYFTALTELDCSLNSLTVLDISQNTGLISLSCGSTRLTTLDVSQNTALVTLRCSYNSLTALDISQNPALTSLNCSVNQLTTLDVSRNIVLKNLICSGNKLTDLDMSNNIELVSLDCDANQLTNINVSRNTALAELRCQSNRLTALDISQNTALAELRCQNNRLTALDVSQNTALTYLQCEDNQLTVLNIGQNAALTTLFCNNNQLTALDVSDATALEFMSCDRNQLTTLDVSGATALVTLWCSNNQLTALDVSNATVLSELWCHNNQLTTIDVSNAATLTSILCQNNQLTTLDVSNAAALTTLRCENNRLTSLDLSNNQNVSFLSGTQSVHLSQIPANSYDLFQRDSNIDGTKITNPTGAIFDGTVMSGYRRGVPITYTYDCGNGYTMNVTLNFELSAGTFNIFYKDGQDDFNGWKTDYIAPSTYEEGTGVVLPTAENIAKEGYTFIGWYDNEALTGNPITELDAAATGDITLYAKFGENQTMTDAQQENANLQAAQTGDNHIVEPLLATGGIASLAAAAAFFFKKKRKSE